MLNMNIIYKKEYNQNFKYYTGLNRDKKLQFPTKQNRKNHPLGIPEPQSVQTTQILRRNTDGNSSQSSYSQVLQNTGPNAQSRAPNQEIRVQNSDNGQKKVINKQQYVVNDVNISGDKTTRKQPQNAVKIPFQNNAIPQAPIQAFSELNLNATKSNVIVNDGSDALKKILGIFPSNDSKGNNLPATTPVDLNEMFKRSAQSSAKSPATTDFMVGLPKTLPQPPLNWRTDMNKSKTIQEEAAIMPKPNQIHQNEAQLNQSLMETLGLSKPSNPQQQTPLQSQIAHSQVPMMSQPHGLPHPPQFMPPFYPHPPHPTFVPHQQSFNQPMHPMAMPSNAAPPNMHPMPINNLPHNIPPFINQSGQMNFFGNQHMPPAFPNHPNALGPAQHNVFSQLVSQRQPQLPANQQGFDGQNNVSNNNKYTVGHGAFIPLQAARKIVKPKVVGEPAQASVEKVGDSLFDTILF